MDPVQDLLVGIEHRREGVSRLFGVVGIEGRREGVSREARSIGCCKAGTSLGAECEVLRSDRVRGASYSAREPIF